MCEVQDIRTAPWGYAAKAIIDFLSERGFQWFSFSEGGGLKPIPSDQAGFDGNYVAIPDERIAGVSLRSTSVSKGVPRVKEH
jgi:hypothetical protein